MIFMLGTAVGSFLNVLISRTATGEAWVKGRSRCDHCQRVLSWYELVPIVSYIVLRGRTKCCGKKLSYQHPLVESLVGLLFLWWAALSSGFFLLVTEPGRTVQPLFWLVTGVILFAIAIADLYYGVIPLPFLLTGIGIAVLYRIVLITSGTYQAIDLWRSILSALGLAGFYLFLRIITRGKGMGEGDVWLALYLGLILAWPRVYQATMIAFIMGAVVGVGLIVLKLKTRKDTVPFGPFMILGALVSLLVRF